MTAFLQALNRQKVSWLFVAPAVGLFLVFVVVPIIVSFCWSFTAFDVIHPARFTGLANYVRILCHDPRFWKALVNTSLYVVGVVPSGIVIALLLAVAMEEPIRGKYLFRTLYFMPYATAVAAISVIWKWLFAGEKYGLINYGLIKLGLQPIDWLSSTTWTLPAIMIMSVWAGLGYNLILFSAGLQTIPQSLYEAAEIDGAGWCQKFWHVTLPLLRPMLTFVVIMSVITSYQVFDQVYIMTSGVGEGAIGGVLDSALTIVAYLYDMGFQRFQMGYASALAFLLFVSLLGLTLFNLRQLRSRVDY